MNVAMELEKREAAKAKRSLKIDKKSSLTLKLNNNKNNKTHQFSAVSKFFLPEKRARRNIRIPKFLLGGNISDPLNLNGLHQVITTISPTTYHRIIFTDISKSNFSFIFFCRMNQKMKMKKMRIKWS